MGFGGSARTTRPAATTSSSSRSNRSSQSSQSSRSSRSSRSNQSSRSSRSSRSSQSSRSNRGSRADSRSNRGSQAEWGDYSGLGYTRDASGSHNLDPNANNNCGWAMQRAQQQRNSAREQARALEEHNRRAAQYGRDLATRAASQWATGRADTARYYPWT